MINIKICGITNLADAKLAQKLGAKFLGFIFYKKSPRYVSPSLAKKIITQLKSSVLPVGVFVNEPLKKIKQIAQGCGIKILQLHGNESPQYSNILRRDGFKVIKVLRIKNKDSLKPISKYDSKVDAFLFDTYSKESFGGTGKVFDWKILGMDFKVPIFLSGGINSQNVKKATRIIKPYAIDASSSLEKYPGKKDSILLKQFFHSLFPVTAYR